MTRYDPREWRDQQGEPSERSREIAARYRSRWRDRWKGYDADEHFAIVESLEEAARLGRQTPYPYYLEHDGNTEDD